jgi:membrane protease YdiL (CAAX protease family)
MKNQPNSSSPRLSSPWSFFIVAFCWSWFFWILAALSGQGMTTIPGQALLFLGLLGPMAAGIYFTYRTQAKAGIRDYWVRIVDVRRIGIRWYLLIALFVPALTALAAALDVLSGGSGATWEEAAVYIFSEPLAIIPFALYLFFIGPFIEDLGWRGFVLDRLQATRSAMVSSLILGALWALWHLPLFLIKDTYQYNLGFLSPSFWLFMVNIFPLAIILTWIFNNTRRSTLAAILFHFMVNFTGELVAAAGRVDVFSALLWIAAAIVVAAVWGARKLEGRG